MLRVVVFVSAVFIALVEVIQPPTAQPSASLGRLVFTDYPKPHYDFTVDVFDFAASKRFSLPIEEYQDIGVLSKIDADHAYISLCFVYDHPFCSAPVSQIINPQDVQRFDNVKQFWKESYYSPVWSPDGTHIAFSRFKNKGTLDNPIRGGNTYIMNADGTNLLDLTPNEDDNGFSFGWSPDSQRVAFGCADEASLCIVNVDGTDLQILNLPSNTSRAEDVVWSPDGSQIVFSLGVKMIPYRRMFYIVNADGSNMHRLLEKDTEIAADPVWSPDGSKIAFELDGQDHSGSGEIYVAQADGSGLHSISSSLQGEQSDADWSPDSANLAFFSNEVDEVDLYIADANNRGMPRLITENSTWNISEWEKPELFWIP